MPITGCYRCGRARFHGMPATGREPVRSSRWARMCKSRRMYAEATTATASFPRSRTATPRSTLPSARWARPDRCAAGMRVMQRMPPRRLTRRPSRNDDYRTQRHVRRLDAPMASCFAVGPTTPPAPPTSRSPAVPRRSTYRRGRPPPPPRCAQRPGRCRGEPPAARAFRTSCR